MTREESLMDLNDLPESIQHTVAFAEDMTGDQQTNRSTLTVQQPVLVTSTSSVCLSIVL